MTDPQAGAEGDLIGLEEASELLEVPVEQVRVMVEDAMLTPADPDASEPQFLRAEVVAARQLGG